jgi:hypothetical protein
MVARPHVARCFAAAAGMASSDSCAAIDLAIPVTVIVYAALLWGI